MVTAAKGRLCDATSVCAFAQPRSKRNFPFVTHPEPADARAYTSNHTLT